MHIDMDQISQIIEEVAEEVIMPRFKKLGEGEIMDKGKNDLVTVADIEAEKKLTTRLKDILPGSNVVGEEACSENPNFFNALEDESPVWVIDPVDGTRNFASGRDAFASMVALCRNKEIIASWIDDPARTRMAIAENGAGAQLAGNQLICAETTTFENMVISLNPDHRRWLEKRADDGLNPKAKMAPRYGSAAHDYISLACGEFHCAQYKRLKPWDHAPGVLLFREAGGYDAMIETKEAYAPQMYVGNALLMAPCKETWEEARAFLNPVTTYND